VPVVALFTALVVAALAPARFAPGPGWHVGAARAHACVGVSAARCTQAESWAATVPWRDCPECLPHRTLAALPPDGIAMHLTVAVEDPPVGRASSSWPPRLHAGDLVAGMEGVPSRYAVFQRVARVGRRELFVWVFFGRSRPTPAALRAANAVLRSVRIA